MLFGDRFPMIRAHKVLAAYGCLVPRVVTGQFDPTSHRAVWPSTGNYCRGGVAISRLMSCRGVAVLPEGMSRERFAWLEDWVADPADIIATPGTESNVKEIYDKCAELSADPANVIFNQFSEFGNHLVHYLCTGAALGDVFDRCSESDPPCGCAAFVSASGSAGTLGTGDYLKESYGARIVAVEALECPTMLYNGFGEHNIQGIGDKHIPLIHNVYNTDIVTAVSDQRDGPSRLVFGTDAGRTFLAERRHVPAETFAVLDRPLEHLQHPCRREDGQVPRTRSRRGRHDRGDRRCRNVRERTGAHRGAGLPGRIRRRPCRRGAFGRHMAGAETDHLLEMTAVDRASVFNLGYFTWVEQQGVAVDEFTRGATSPRGAPCGRRSLSWDGLIREFNARTGVAVP